MDSNAWLLHHYPSGQTSLKLVFFTREAGKVIGLFKGGRNLKKHEPVSAFTRLWISYSVSNGWCYVNKTNNFSAPLVLKDTRLFAAFYINELLYYFLQPGEPYPHLYDAYEHTLYALETETTPEVLELCLREFEWIVLREGGYSLACEDIKARAHYVFVPGEGFKLSASGYLGEHIQAIIAGDFADAAILYTAKRVMRQAIADLLNGHQFISRQLYRSYHG